MDFQKKSRSCGLRSSLNPVLGKWHFDVVQNFDGSDFVSVIINNFHDIANLNFIISKKVDVNCDSSSFYCSFTIEVRPRYRKRRLSLLGIR